MKRFKLLLVVCLLSGVPALAEELEGDYLYRVSTVRAAPGALPDLLAWLGDLQESGYYADSGEAEPFVMRHSQGDQWDLMIITPMGSFTAFYAERAVERRGAAAEKHAQVIAPVESLIAFHEENYALGPPRDALAAAYRDNSLYHVEMFAALPGKAAELVHERRMENAYLAAIGLTPNMIFRRVAGSDIDVFTIGFHRDLAAFAADSPAGGEQREAAAKAAGFASRADISFYLRRLIAGHHDTLAVKVD